MGGLAHYLEEDGLATTQISLIRLHSEKTRPPRALWVPFELGRPLGPPNDAPFQRRVLMAVLELLKAPSGPLLTDYAEDAPKATEAEMEGWVCPINLAPPALDGDGDADLRQRRQGKRPLVETGVGYLQPRQVDRAVAVQKNVHVDQTRAVAEPSLPAHLHLQPFHRFQ